MGIFSKISDALGGKSAETRALEKELAALKRDGRMHARHVIHEAGLVTVTAPSGAVGTIRDVSYSGFGVVFPLEAKSRIPESMTAILAKVRIFDLELAVKVTPVHWVERPGQGVFVGMSIQHESPATLTAVKSLIEPLGWGGSLQPIGPGLRSERYSGDEWLCFRGDGPTDVVARLSADKQSVVEALITFRIKDAYHDVALRDGHLQTSKSTDAAMYGGAQMAGTGLDPVVLRYAIAVLVAAPTAARQQAKPLLAKLVEAFQQRTQKAS